MSKTIFVGTALLFAIGNAEKECVDAPLGTTAPWDGYYTSTDGTIENISIVKGMSAPKNGKFCRGDTGSSKKAKCRVEDMHGIFGGDASDARRRNPFAGVPEACMPCVEGCAKKLFYDGLATEEPDAETAAKYMSCVMGCPETDFPGQCKLEEISKLEQQNSDPTGNGGDPAEAMKNPFAHVEGISGGCQKCLQKCAEVTVQEAFTQLGSVLDSAVNGSGDLSGQENTDPADLEKAFTAMGLCVECCAGLEIAAGKTCKAAFGTKVGSFNAPSGGGGSSDNAGMIAGIVVGVLLAIGLVGGLACYCHVQNKENVVLSQLNHPSYETQSPRVVTTSGEGGVALV